MVKKPPVDLDSIYEALERMAVPERQTHYVNDGDVLALPTPEQLMQFPKPRPEARAAVAGKLAAILRNTTDCFRSLPLEIREAIAVSLPTRSALNLCHVSRAMVHVFESAAFWRTRFAFDAERGSLHLVAEGIIDEKGVNGIERSTPAIL